MTASQTYLDANITQSLIKNYGKTLSCHEANKAYHPACRRSCFTDAVDYPPRPCINLPSVQLHGMESTWEDQYCIISPPSIYLVVANELSFSCYKPSAQRERTRKSRKRSHPRRRRMLPGRIALGIVPESQEHKKA